MTLELDDARPVTTSDDLARLRQRRRAVSALRSALGIPALPPEVVSTYRPRSLELTERITSRIQREVAAFAAGADPDMRAGLTVAISTSVRLFVDTLADVATSSPADVFAFFRLVGRAQAVAGHDLDAVRAAHQIATQESWRDLRSISEELGLPAADTGRLGDAVFAFQDQLLDQTVLGYVMARREGRRPSARGRLLAALLTGGASGEVGDAAAECGWTVPDRVVVAAVDALGRDLRPTLSEHPTVLSGVRHGVLTLVGAPADVRAAVRHVGLSTSMRTGLTWDVPIADAHHASRWAHRALRLLGDGVVDADEHGVAHCSDHRHLLWMEADPALRRHTTAQLLEPLADEKPAHRSALAQTLTLWLQTRGSAPALARELGVHEQTVRQRLRRVKQLFGEQLDDPDRVGELLAALEASAPHRASEATAS